MRMQSNTAVQEAYKDAGMEMARTDGVSPLREPRIPPQNRAVIGFVTHVDARRRLTTPFLPACLFVRLWMFPPPQCSSHLKQVVVRSQSASLCLDR